MENKGKQIDRRTFMKSALVAGAAAVMAPFVEPVVEAAQTEASKAAGNNEKAVKEAGSNGARKQMVAEGNNVRVWLEKTVKHGDEDKTDSGENVNEVLWKADLACTPDGKVNYKIHSTIPDSRTTWVDGDPIEQTVMPGYKGLGTARATVYDNSGEVPKPIGAEEFDWSLWVEKCDVQQPFKTYLPFVSRSDK